VTLTVLLFAKLRDLAGAEAVAIELPAGATVTDLRRRLAELHPAVAPLLERSAVAVNHDFADHALVLRLGDEVAVIPPVSGG
jgi:molybdopterin converting factor subunit 1